MSNKIALGFIGIVILSSFIFIVLSFNTTANAENEHVNSKTFNNEVLTKEDLAELLSISVEELGEIIAEDVVEKSKRSNYDTYQYIPTIDIAGKTRFLE